MVHKRDKAQKARIAILAFSLLMFVVLDCGFVYYGAIYL
jgi:hypothetical protein